MKRSLLSLYLLLLSITAFAQRDACIINFISPKAGVEEHPTYKIYANDYLVGAIKENENLELTMRSEGELTITIIYDDSRHTRSINVSTGNTYYFSIRTNDLVSEEKGLKMLGRVERTITMTENKDHRIAQPKAAIAPAAEGTSVINFISKKTNMKGSPSYKIYLNDKLVGAVKENENFKYSMFSSGRISIMIIANKVRHTNTIDIKKGSTNYFSISDNEIVSKIKGRHMLENVENTINTQEDKARPIVP